MPSPETLIARYTAAATALDKDALLALYAPDVRLFDLMRPWQVRGTEDWGTSVDSWFADVGTDPEVTASDIDVRTTAEMAVLTMRMDYYHVNADGEREGMPNRLTWVAIPNGDDWVIVHEHTSVPLNEETMSPFLEAE